MWYILRHKSRIHSLGAVESRVCADFRARHLARRAAENDKVALFKTSLLDQLGKSFGLDTEQLERQLKVMKAVKAHSKRGEMLQALGEPIGRFGIVLGGAVRVCVDDIEGSRMIMAEVAPGNSFGESLCRSEKA